MAKEQVRLLHEVHDKFSFLFTQVGGQIIPNSDVGHLAVLQSTIVTVAIEGLLVRFLRWRDNDQVHVASERLPNK